MKVTLIVPAFQGRGVVKQYGFKILPYGLLQLASVTPPGVEVEIVDEKVEPIPSRLDTDLVGVSVFTTAIAPRAYEVAARYRAQGIPVVMGGAHPSALPEEALGFADSVVVGEGEAVWPEVLQDARRGALKPIYRAPAPDLSTLPRRHPWHLLRTARYPAPMVVQTSRGCPVDCDFCSSRPSPGRRCATNGSSTCSRSSWSSRPFARASTRAWPTRSSSSTTPSGPTSSTTRP